MHDLIQYLIILLYTLIECTFFLRTSNRIYIEQSRTSIGRSMKLQTFDYKQISTRNFIYKAEISKVISQGSSGSVVKDGGVRYGGPWFELW